MPKMPIGDEHHAHESQAYETLTTAKSHPQPNYQRARSFLRIRSFRSSRIYSFSNDAHRKWSQQHLELLFLVEHDDVCVVDELLDLDDGVLSIMLMVLKT